MTYRGLTLKQAPRGIYVYEGDDLEYLAGPFSSLKAAHLWIDGHKRRQGDFSKEQSQ